MVDLPRIRKGVPGAQAPATMPPPPVPASDIDLPAPAVPVKPPVKEERETLPVTPVHMAAKPREMTEPIKLPDMGGKPRERETKAIHGSPPVFIKIDKYTDIIKNLQKLKTYSLSLRDALDAMSDIEKELTTGISISNKALDDFNTIIAVLDSKLLRANAIDDFDAGAPDDVERYIKGIYEQMDKIKTELKDIS